MAQGTIRKCIVKESSRIRMLLKQRFDEQKISYTYIVDDARARGLEITVQSLSRFIKHGNVKSTIRQEDIIWLCFRYGIEIQLMVGSPQVQKDGTIKLYLPEYDEAKCLKWLDRYITSTKDATKPTNNKSD